MMPAENTPSLVHWKIAIRNSWGRRIYKDITKAFTWSNGTTAVIIAVDTLHERTPLEGMWPDRSFHLHNLIFTDTWKMDARNVLISKRSTSDHRTTTRRIQTRWKISCRGLEQSSRDNLPTAHQPIIPHLQEYLPVDMIYLSHQRQEATFSATIIWQEKIIKSQSGRTNESLEKPKLYLCQLLAIPNSVT